MNYSELALSSAITAASERLMGVVTVHVDDGTISEGEGARAVSGVADFLILLGEELTRIGTEDLNLV